MAKAREMQEKMTAIQDELGRKTVTADAGGGLVEATCNGRRELVRIKLDKARLDVNDTEMLEDLIVAAVHAAQDKAADLAKSEMQRVASEMGVPPGMLPH
jgi:DNA-binding YbaB/EbfC family protein